MEVLGGRAFAGVLSGLVTVGGATLMSFLNSGFCTAAAKSPGMGVAAMAVPLVNACLIHVLSSCMGCDILREQGLVQRQRRVYNE